LETHFSLAAFYAATLRTGAGASKTRDDDRSGLASPSVFSGKGVLGAVCTDASSLRDVQAVFIRGWFRLFRTIDADGSKTPLFCPGLLFAPRKTPLVRNFAGQCLQATHQE